MSDPTTTPTPTEPHRDVREEWAARLQCADVGVDFPWLTEDGCDVWLEQSEATQEHYRDLLRVALSAGLQIPPAAAVSAAAPDERLCYSDECGEPCQSWQAMKRAEIEHLRRENATIAQRLGEARAALAARPAPVVSGEAVEAAARRLYVRTAKDNTTHDEAVVPWADLHPHTKDRWLDYARDALTAALGITVADEGRAAAPAAECNCGFGGAHDPANPRCRVNDPTEAWIAPAADDEGGQE
jgi:hypothetical protein